MFRVVEEICRVRKRPASEVQRDAKLGRYVIATVSVEKNVEEQILVPEDCLPGGPKENEFIAQCANCGQELVAFQSVFIHFAGLEKTRKQKPGKKSKVRIIQQYDCNLGSFIEKPNPWRAMAKESKEKEGREHSVKSSSATQKANAQISRILNQHASAVQQQKQSQQQQQQQKLHQQILPALEQQQQQQSSWVQVQTVSAGQPLWAADLSQWGNDGQQAAWLWATTPHQWVLNADDNQQWLTLSPEQIGWQVGPDGVLQAPQFITCMPSATITTDNGLTPSSTTLTNGEQLQDQKPVAAQLDGVTVTSTTADSTQQQQQQAAAPVVAVQLWNGQQINGLVQQQPGGTFVLANNLTQTLLGSAGVPAALDNNGTYVNVTNGVVNIMPLDGDIDFLDRSDLAGQVGSSMAAATASAATTTTSAAAAVSGETSKGEDVTTVTGSSAAASAAAVASSAVTNINTVSTTVANNVQPAVSMELLFAEQLGPVTGSTMAAGDVSNAMPIASSVTEQQQLQVSTPQATTSSDARGNVETEPKMDDAGQESEHPADAWTGEAGKMLVVAMHLYGFSDEFSVVCIVISFICTLV